MTFSDVAALDVYTLLHILSTFSTGLIGRLLGFSVGFTLNFGTFLILYWEFMEKHGEFVHFGFFPESFPNTLADIAIGFIFVSVGTIVHDKAFKRKSRQ